ncbi:MAG: RNA polymerase sigma factor SigB [Heyndrickxia faecalis]|jgi:RNA polymerase sigma-B factor|uniref:RNA polymerase sigma factor SigB n=1 Tax=Heyndrickxia TaxID=2837504 RepID=UPI0002F376E2|nr:MULTISPECIES: RNA polymerase sigma factor SigB [Heyndrickxia]MCI1575565.1 RNA polymerase sigma factor SigB [Heyndrickxia coagulans]MED4840589.1 RNA polymerase sigma factor SigB [Weizmannia sp. CD-2023]MED4900963.1 RNA polymerase sigma factor SigB [Weizmannia sp. CD-2023]NMH83436.1 RNA polymerase sigma factor SigB [Heyndrickxia coagulans]UXC22258.1 RNA polymerase sigma factor SigB [Heyndrickxia coagulans]
MSKLPQPDQIDVNQLIQSYQQNGDKEAQEILVAHYQKLVESLARKYSKGRAYQEDIFQVGIIGLLGAIQRFDPNIGKSFESFAIPTIIGEIKRFLRDKTWSVHVPRRIKELGPRIKSTVEKLTNELQRSPKIAEIAAHLEISEEEVLEAMEMSKSYHALSVDHSIESDSDGSTVTLLDMVGSEDDGYEKVNQRLVLEKVLHVLSERERQVIHYTYIENLSQKDTGEKLGISQMHVSRLQRRAIKKLRDAIEGELQHVEN